MQRNNRKWQTASSDGVIQERQIWCPGDEQLQTVRTQASENLILQMNQHLQIEKPMMDLGGADGWGRMEANIPEIAWERLVRERPALIKGDPQTQKRELAKVLQEHPEWRV